MKISEVIDYEFRDSDLGQTTIREYLKTLLLTLLEEGESFSGKRPFGNSGWESWAELPLIKAGILKGSIHSEDDCDYEEVDSVEFTDDMYQDVLTEIVEEIFK